MMFVRVTNFVQDHLHQLMQFVMVIHSSYLFSQFHKKKGSLHADDYSMPHTWINLSFYTAKKKVGYGRFVPRIKLPPEKPKSAKREKLYVTSSPCMKPTQETALPNSIFDYNAYDAQVFKLPTNQSNK